MLEYIFRFLLLACPDLLDLQIVEHDMDARVQSNFNFQSQGFLRSRNITVVVRLAASGDHTPVLPCLSSVTSGQR
jgi:hypothetical protein